MELLDAQTLARLAGREAARPRGGGGRALRPAQEPPPGPERGVRRAQGVRAGRRAPPPGLEGVRQVRQVLRQALRARDQPARHAGGRCAPARMGYRSGAALQAGGGHHARRRAGVPAGAPAGRGGPGASSPGGRMPGRAAARRGRAPAHALLDALERSQPSGAHGPLRRGGPPGREVLRRAVSWWSSSPTCSTTGTTRSSASSPCGPRKNDVALFHVRRPRRADLPLRRPHALPLAWRTSGGSR